MATLTWGERGIDDYSGVTSDTHVIEGEPLDNNGASALIIVANNNFIVPNESTVLIKFDTSALSGLIANSTQITSATLYMDVFSGSGGPKTHNIHRVVRDWGEGNKDGTAATSGEANWADAKFSVDSWGTAGCNNTTTDIVSAPTDSILSPGGGLESYDLTVDVKAFFDGTNNYGWAIKIPTPGMLWLDRFASSSNGTLLERPYLEIVLSEGSVSSSSSSRSSSSLSSSSRSSSSSSSSSRSSSSSSRSSSSSSSSSRSSSSSSRSSSSSSSSSSLSSSSSSSSSTSSSSSAITVTVPVTFEVTEDTYIEFITANNYTSSDIIKVGAWFSGSKSQQHNGLIRFDISTLPSNHGIDSAKLHILSKRKLKGGNILVDVKRVKRDWNNSKVDWKHYDETSTTVMDSTSIVTSFIWWEKNGCYGNSDRNLQTESGTEISDATSEESWYTWDVTEAARNAEDTGTNCKLVLQRRWHDSSEGIWSFYSMENDAGKRPYLIINMLSSSSSLSSSSRSSSSSSSSSSSLSSSSSSSSSRSSSSSSLSSSSSSSNSSSSSSSSLSSSSSSSSSSLSSSSSSSNSSSSSSSSLSSSSSRSSLSSLSSSSATPLWVQRTQLSAETPSQNYVYSVGVGEGSDLMVAGTAGNVSDQGQIWGSTDAITWTLRWDSTLETRPQDAVLAFAYDSTNNVIVAGTAGEAEIWTASGGQMDTWVFKKSFYDDSGGDTQNVQSLLFVPAGGGILLAGLGVQAEVWKSTDGGDTWTLKKDFNAEFGDSTVQDMCWDSTRGRVIAFVTGSSQAKIYTSDDLGEAWTFRDGFSPKRFARSIVYDPLHDVVLAGHGFGGARVSKSIDGGVNWTTAVDWGTIDYPLSMYYHDGLQTVFIGTQDSINAEIYTTTDGGTIFNLEFTDFGTTYCYDLAYAPVNNMLLAGIAFGGEVWTRND